MPALKELIGEGYEHMVYKRPTSKFVLKTPTPLNIKSIRLSGKGPRALDSEREFWEKMISNSPVRIPPTRMFLSESKVYIMGQRFIEEDGSIEDVASYLRSQGLQVLARKYELDPTNFKSNQGVLYLIDPTKGIEGRLIERFLKIPYPVFITLRWGYKRLKESLKHFS